MRILSRFSLVLCVALMASGAYAADSYYVKIEGTKQGGFKGEVSRKGSGWIRALQVSSGIVSPRRDAASGLPSGKRQYKPVVIRKEVDTTSPKIFRALTTNEVLKQVVIEFVRSDPAGKEEVYQTITLVDGHIDNYKKIPSTAKGRGPKEEEEFEIIYQKIEVTDKVGKAMAQDDWETRQ